MPPKPLMTALFSDNEDRTRIARMKRCPLLPISIANRFGGLVHKFNVWIWLINVFYYCKLFVISSLTYTKCLNEATQLTAPQLIHILVVQKAVPTSSYFNRMAANWMKYHANVYTTNDYFIIIIYGFISNEIRVQINLYIILTWIQNEAAPITSVETAQMRKRIFCKLSSK